MRSLLRLVICVLFSVLSYAQSPNATVTGRVTDPINAMIAGAEVEVTNLYTNIRYTGQTNREGSFVIPSLPPGPYRIEVKKSGFKTVVREDVVLSVLKGCARACIDRVG
jgi:carboxypeptidase family protein